MGNDIHFKAAFYGIALFLSPFADKIIPILFQDKWPSLPMVAGCALLGVIACSIGLRAYYDGSYERSKSGIKDALVNVPSASPKT